MHSKVTKVVFGLVYAICLGLIIGCGARAVEPSQRLVSAPPNIGDEPVIDPDVDIDIQQQTVHVEAETLTGRCVVPYQDWGALLYCPTRITTPVEIAVSGIYELRANVSASNAGAELPHMDFVVDDAYVGAVDVNAEAPATVEYSVPAVLTEGRHDIGIAFVNDHFDADGGDRNLIVDWIEVFGPVE